MLAGEDAHAEGDGVGRLHRAAVGGHTTDGDELAAAAGERLREQADAAVGRNHDVERALAEGGLDGLAEMRVGVDVLHRR